MTNLEQVQDRILELQTAIETAIPGYTTILRSLHTTLKNDPDIVTMLTAEEVGIIVSGLSKHKGIVIAKTLSAASKKKVAAMSLMDL